jgi:spermidine synthase
MITIADIKTRHGQISVLRNRQTGAIVYWQDSAYQSEADDRGVSLATYIHALYGLIRQGNCKDVLLIGCGGGTLGTMLSAGGTRVTMIDVNAWSFALARQYFSLPASIECLIADGMEYLQSASRMFDAIILDAYQESKIPGQFFGDSFAKTVAARLNPEGLFLANVFVSHDLDDAADRFADAFQESWRCVRLLDQSNSPDRNVIVTAGAVDSLERPTLILPPRYGDQEIIDGLRNTRFRPVRQLRSRLPS